MKQITDEETKREAQIFFERNISETTEYAFYMGAKWMREQVSEEITPIWIPYQVCPICNGQGRVVADEFTSSVFQNCPTCNGLRIIVMYEKPLPFLTH